MLEPMEFIEAPRRWSVWGFHSHHGRSGLNGCFTRNGGNILKGETQMPLAHGRRVVAVLPKHRGKGEPILRDQRFRIAIQHAALQP